MIIKNAKAVIRKGGLLKSRPWVVDIHWEDGVVWKAWAYDMKTKRAATQHCEAVGVEVVS